MVEGQIYTRPKFAKTLRQIAEQGPAIFYNGSLGRTIVEELQNLGGIITLEDLKSYR